VDRDRARKAAFDRKRGTSAQRGYDAEWQAARSAWLAAYPSCRRCGQRATVVDHIESIRKAPHRRLDRTNFMSLCTPCHSGWKQSQERN
jgi:5-methylcytosine-specific restriction endonuclease McrA